MSKNVEAVVTSQGWVSEMVRGTFEPGDRVLIVPDARGDDELEELIVTCMQCAETVGGPIALLATKLAVRYGIEDRPDEDQLDVLDDEAPEEAAEIRELIGSAAEVES